MSNHLGSATAPAMQLLKVMLGANSDHISLFPLPDDPPREEDFQLDDAWNGVSVTMREAHLMAANHDVVQGLYWCR